MVDYCLAFIQRLGVSLRVHSKALCYERENKLWTMSAFKINIVITLDILPYPIIKLKLMPSLESKIKMEKSLISKVEGNVDLILRWKIALNSTLHKTLTADLLGSRLQSLKITAIWLCLIYISFGFDLSGKTLIFISFEVFPHFCDFVIFFSNTIEWPSWVVFQHLPLHHPHITRKWKKIDYHCLYERLGKWNNFLLFHCSSRHELFPNDNDKLHSNWPLICLMCFYYFEWYFDCFSSFFQLQRKRKFPQWFISRVVE